MPQSGHSYRTCAGGSDPVLRASRSLGEAGVRVAWCSGCGQYAFCFITAALWRMAGEGELEKEWNKLFGCSIARISSSLCLSVVLPLGVMFGGTSFAGWCSESTPGAARWRAELWICRGLEDCFEAADDVNVRRRAAFWATGRAVGTAAIRRQRVQMFLEAMVYSMYLYQARLPACDWTCLCAIDVSMGPKEMVCPPRVPSNLAGEASIFCRQAPRLGAPSQAKI